MTGYQALANAIIVQAANDYTTAIRTIKRHPNSRAAMEEAMECEQFFRSGWFATLTDLNPDYLIDKLRKEAVS